MGIQDTARRFYLRKDIQKALFGSARDREIAARYTDRFGKRPDTLVYENDVAGLARRGATSFHCSEELWEDPLKLKAGLAREELDKLRKGWDLILDVDCKYIEYSKITASLLIKALYFHKISSVSVKFSGGTGFHIAVPFSSFPERVGEIVVKNYFPEGPRLVAAYLKDMIKKRLKENILELDSVKNISKNTGKSKEELMEKRCKECKNIAREETIITLVCEICKQESSNAVDFFDEVRRRTCPKCNKIMHLKGKERMYRCLKCKKNSIDNPGSFKTGAEFDPFSVMEIDTALISSRHLFRMPFSLNEKTSLVSVVIRPEFLEKFEPWVAQPENVVTFRPFIVEPKHKGEAKELLVQALDWQKRKGRDVLAELRRAELGQIGERKLEAFEIKVPLREEFFAPCVRNILQGMKHDGRKRALFVLVNYFSSLKVPYDEIEKRVREWNEKNYKPLSESYLKGQLNWHRSQKKKFLPPNCANPFYRDLGVHTDACKQTRNPVYYTLRRMRYARPARKKRGRGRKRGK